jgi:hypothetical protein
LASGIIQEDPSKAPNASYKDEVCSYKRRRYMARQAKDEEREKRIQMEIIVDAYGPEEQALGWYNYVADTLQFPFTAHCIVRRAISPLEPGDELEVVGIAPEEECRHEMFVLTRWRPHELAIPLMQVEAIDADEGTHQAIEDWHYWVNQARVALRCCAADE